MRDTALADALRGCGDGPLLLCHVGAATTPDPREIGPGVEVVDLRGADGRAFDGPVERLVFLAATTGDLCAAVPLSEGLPPAAGFGVVVEASAPHTGPPLPAPPGLGQWEGLLDFQVGRLPDQGWTCSFAFTDPVETRTVLRAVAQAMVGGRRGQAPPRREAPDVVPETVPTWAVLGRSGALSARSTLQELSVRDVPVVDERVVNPMGFTRVSSSRVGRLVSRDGRWVLVASGGLRWRVPEDGVVSDVDVAGLRDLRAVRVEWGRHSGPLAAVRAVVGLAAAGIPLVSGPIPGWARCLGGELSDLITSVEERLMADPQVREEHSVRLRRVALRVHGSHGRARFLAEAGGPPVPAEPSVSVVLCTRRPEMVGFALRQVARQRGVDVEVVLALHGFSVDVPGVAAAIAEFRRGGRSVVVWEPPGDLVFGSVLNGAVARASGALVAKMDDDDWYGPEHLSDLVLARRYSGADLVGCAAEFHHLEHLGLTVRRQVSSEVFARHVTGASILTDRTTLEEVGGFRPVRVDEDAGLLDDVRDAGGSVYRIHGLGCVIRRRGTGHTWSETSGYFLREPLRQWRGWRPSALLESSPEDAPTTTTTPDSPTAGSDR